MQVISEYKDLISVIISFFTFLVVLWGVLLARSTLKSQNDIAEQTQKNDYLLAEKKQTADFLFQSREDEKYIEALRVISNLHKKAISLHCLIVPDPSWDDSKKEEMRKNYISVRYILNFYERMAIAVKNGMYNEGMLQETSDTTLRSVYKHTKPLIDEVRKKHDQPTAYIEFERLAERWTKKPLSINT